MRRPSLVISFLAVAITAIRAALPEYPREVRQWPEVSLPPKDDEYRMTAWFSAASALSKKSWEWRVFVEHDQVCAQLSSEPQPSHPDRPEFSAKAGEFSTNLTTAFMHVTDGWLTGFNDGEFGAALYWFSQDGQQNYKISNHQVVDFFSGRDGIYAIEGLGHMGDSSGSVIRIAPAEPGGRWQASTVVKLPSDPRTVSTRRDGTMFITCRDCIVAVGRDRRVTTLLRDPWWYRPTSTVLSPDEQKLYIGMEYFVGEFDIPAKTLRLLVPSDAFLEPFREAEKRLRDYEAEHNMQFYRRPSTK
jgi:hypothetical protein